VEDGLDLVTETELFAAGPTARRRKKQEQVSDVEALIKDLAELNVGDPVVHAAHGIGRYRGLINLDLGEKDANGEPALQEFLHLEYADKAVLYVPVSQLQQISRYTGVSADEAPLHKLGSGQWEKARRKAAEQVRDAAAELLNIYARRAAREGHAFRYSPQDYEAFAADFGFEETADQNAAIHAVIQDMISPRPMDRLVCGDVGFGKTEVALRAAFVAVTGGKQVALLAPPRCWPSSTTRRWWTAFRSGRSRWPRCRVFAPARRSTPRSRAWPAAAWTSWSARTSCSANPPTSKTWAC
jgi:transcription-repair coupling factor (superfamily II helicase)